MLTVDQESSSVFGVPKLIFQEDKILSDDPNSQISKRRDEELQTYSIYQSIRLLLSAIETVALKDQFDASDEMTISVYWSTIKDILKRAEVQIVPSYHELLASAVENNIPLKEILHRAKVNRS